jgi:mannopine transport system substrate-binding protein
MLRRLVIAAALAAASGFAQAQDRQVVIVTTGGGFEQNLRQFIYEPFARETGIRVVPVSASGADQIARVQAMIGSGRVTWDIYFSGEIQAGSERHRALTEDMTEFCARFAARDDLLPGACNATTPGAFPTAARRAGPISGTSRASRARAPSPTSTIRGASWPRR